MTAWSQGLAIAAEGNDIRILNPTVIDPPAETGAGGLRVLGGRRILCLGGQIDAGDDALAIVPGNVGTPGGNRLGMTDIEDVTVIGAALTSRKARAINIGMSQDEQGDGVIPLGRWNFGNGYYLASSIRRCRVSDIAALSYSDRCLRVHNDVSSGVVEDITLARVALTTGPNSANAVIVQDNAGGVRRVRFESVSVFGDVTATVDQEMVRVERVDGFAWVNGRIDAPVGVAKPTLFLGGVIGARIADLSVGCGKAGGIVVDVDTPGTYDVVVGGVTTKVNDFGLVARRCEDVTIAGGVIEDIPAGTTGLRIVAGLNCGARGLRFTPGLVATAGALPAGTTIAYLTARDPAPTDPAPATTGVYKVKAFAGSPQPYTVRYGTDTGPAIGQGLVGGAAAPGTAFAGRGLRMRITAMPIGATFDITVTRVTTATAASLGAGALSCFLDACDVSVLPASTAVAIASGCGHRSADLIPATVSGNFVGGLFEDANRWSATQSFLRLNLAQSTAVVEAAPKTISVSSSLVLIPDIAAVETIAYGAGVTGAPGDLIVLRRANTANPVTLADNTGNLRLETDFQMSSLNDTLTLVRGNTNWLEVARGDN